ncbi:hypothetical protein SO802_018084 [Lithocarpus litseifolius]|uniref:Uncharacterized protein n=1 Tax=Lithocarpus litseifolius TaxID=425828 RepID=A0AAW2CKA0_9ROSI
MASTTMKTVSGRVLSSKPISLKKATTTLSTFVASENGASPVISAYLRRALSAFKELRQHEKELRAPGSDRTSDWSKSEFLSEGDTVGVNSSQIQSIEVSQAPSHKPKKRLRPESIDSFGTNLTPADNGGVESKLKVDAGENSGRAAESGHGDQETSLEIESDRKKHTKKKKKEEKAKAKAKDEDDNIENVQSGGDRMVIEEEPESNKKNKKKKKKKKKKKENDGGDYENNGIEAEEENNIGIEEVKKEKSKKRKSVEEVEVEVDGKNKKKRRKKLVELS